MSYADYCAGFRDGFAGGFNAGLRRGYEMGFSSGYVGGYIDGYRDCSLGLPCQPTLRLAEYKAASPDFFSPSRFDPLPMPKYEFTLPKLDPIPMPKYEFTLPKLDPIPMPKHDQVIPKYYEPSKVLYNDPINLIPKEHGTFRF